MYGAAVRVGRRVLPLDCTGQPAAWLMEGRIAWRCFVLGLATGLPSQALLRQVALLPLAMASSKMTRGLLMALSYGRLLAACWFVVGLFAPNVALAFWESLQADACKSKFFTEQVHLESS